MGNHDMSALDFLRQLCLSWRRRMRRRKHTDILFWS